MPKLLDSVVISKKEKKYLPTFMKKEEEEEEKKKKKKSSLWSSVPLDLVRSTLLGWYTLKIYINNFGIARGDHPQSWSDTEALSNEVS